MSRRAAVLLAGLALAACESKAPPPPPVAINGISIGMSVDAYRDVTTKPPGFQIAGLVGTPDATFVDGKLEKFNWRFQSEKYLLVRGALMTQYPRLKCEIAMGFEVCTVDRTLFLAEGQRGGFYSRVWLERKR